MSNISIIVITKNEERNIADCLQSVTWANDIVVVDSQSTDRTVEIAAAFTTKIFIRPWEGYAKAKGFALQHVDNQWVLWLDADERVTNELAKEIQQIILHASHEVSGYEVARRAFFLGKWIRHCGWYPGYVTRLFRATATHFSTTQVHERLIVNGRIGRLRNDLLHYTDANLYHYFAKYNTYTSLAAQDNLLSGKKFSLMDILIRPPFLFIKMYILRGGFLDGMRGLLLSLLSATYVFTKYAKIWELKKTRHESV